MKNHRWLVPALASLAFLAFSVRVMVTEGPFGFIAEHSRNGWSAQIGIDLVASAVIALYFAAPHARRYGIRSLPWVVATILTGSIGLFAFVARILYVADAAEGTGTFRGGSSTGRRDSALPPLADS